MNNVKGRVRIIKMERGSGSWTADEQSVCKMILTDFVSNFQLYSRLQFVFNARKSHTKPHYLFVLGCEDDLSAWARQRCCPLTQSWKSDEMKTPSPHEPGRDVALSRSPERRSKMKTTSPSQQIPASLTELSLVDQFTLIFGLCTKPNSVTAISL